MIKIPAIYPLLQAWLLEGPLFSQVPAYVESLPERRSALRALDVDVPSARAYAQ
jgi:hypothetical protein